MKRLLSFLLSLALSATMGINVSANSECEIECTYNGITGCEVQSPVLQSYTDEEISQAATDISYSEVDDILFEKCCGDYGYRDLALRENGEAKQYAYELLLESAKEFFMSDKTLTQTSSSGHFIIEKIPFDDNENFQYYLTNHQLYEAYFTFRKDNPLFYFTATTVIVNGFYADKDGDGINDTYSDGTPILYVTSISYLTDEDYITPQARSACKNNIVKHLFEYSEYLEGFMSVFEKVEALNKKLCDEISYAFDGSSASAEPWAHNIMGVFDDEINSAVCEGYSYAFDIVMSYIGLDSIIVSGLGNGAAHAWNLVGLDDEYFFIDSTWNDTTSNAYFLKGTDNFYLDHSIETPENIGVDFLYQLPAISADDYNPIVVENDSVSILINEQGVIGYEILGSYSSDSVRITSDNPDIVQITDNGEYTALLAGEAQITIKTADNRFSKTVSVSVINNKGDINSDRKVNLRDVVLLYQYVSRWNVEVDAAVSDVNADGSINLRDVVLLYQYVSGWAVEI